VSSAATLPGWDADDLIGAAEAYARGHKDALPALPDGCRDTDDLRAFVLRAFRPGPSVAGRVTAYYEPELPASPVPTARFRWPVYAPPAGLPPAGGRWLARAEIEDSGVLVGQGLELAWLDDPVAVFFLMIQGSGRLRMPDGTSVRLGFAAKNGWPYVSVGAILREAGAFGSEPATAQAIGAWLRADPVRGAAMMRRNPGYVFFQIRRELAPADGPVGTLGVPLTAGRSVAVDAGHIALGSPVWIDSDDPGVGQRLWFAQDTGGAIIGPGRVDLYLGSGAAAGAAAGRIDAVARVTPLLPAVGS
jgi:membrane-bound lytic murein transglycosylase A